MDLKKLHIGTVSYGKDTSDEVTSLLKASFAQSVDSSSSANSFRNRRDLTTRIRDVVQALALCHNVTPVVEGDGIMYQAASPDEIAIVRWTASVGLALSHRDLSRMTLEFQSGQTFDFDILQVFPFTSETKRMGIIVRDLQTQEIVFYMKGADSVMAKIVEYNDWLQEECENMSREGLRTLVIGKRRLTQEQYDSFERKLAWFSNRRWLF